MAFGIAAVGHLSSGVAVLVIWDVLVLAAAGRQLWLQRPQRVRITRHPLERLSIGRENLVTLDVQGTDVPLEVQIRDSYPVSFASSALTLTATIPAHGHVTLTYTVRPQHRGEYTWGSLHIRQRQSGSLVWQQWVVPQPQTVAVYPDLIGLQELSLQLALFGSGSRTQRRSLALGTEFQELREYHPGDDLRLMHWPSTARHQRPVVRVMTPEQEQTLILLLDRGRLMTATVAELPRFDWGLNALLALALTALHSGDRVGVGLFDRQLSTWIPPQRGKAHLSTLVERLTPSQPDWLEPDYVEAVSAVRRFQSRRALVVILTDIVDQTASQELLTAMGRLSPRFLPLCVALRDPLLDHLAQDRSQPYQRAVALDLLHQRRTALAYAQRQGSLVLDLPAPQIRQALLDEYIRIKLKQRL
ncbi:MAG: DUF58 domain-containing protein [Synechococcales cyanobacterium]